eukprot:CAMPEP_0176426962 /NCGR_PEP_ID=MMETSP0127-20121128/12251_1 /TAXON_ID=938130 /ORGANISM="Platyophrya macrostoma, Strain WH" /LENGTH=430 /DNA_ID=CAMNT_0017808323 /DNA_START=187 /DNA_END=1479 /DNA_ORIENTATION=+
MLRNLARTTEATTWKFNQPTRLVRRVLRQRSVHAAVGAGYVPVTELERVDRERHRYLKMYEHQKTLYEEMAATQQETHQKLQDKIIEVVALSTRNEESKRFIRQLKREMLENRTRTLDLHNRQWEEQRQEKGANLRFEETLERQEAHFTTLLSQQESRMAGLEGLVRDLTVLKGESTSLHVSQLDQLLKASYSKNAALFGDLMRVNRQFDLVCERKSEMERTVEALRRELKDVDRSILLERRHMNMQCDRFMEQVSEQQQMILELRQCLVRSMASDTSSSGSGSDGDDLVALAGFDRSPTDRDACDGVVPFQEKEEALRESTETNVTDATIARRVPSWRPRDATDRWEAQSGMGMMDGDDSHPPPSAEEAEARLLASAGGDFVCRSVGGETTREPDEQHHAPVQRPPPTGCGVAPFRPIRRLRAVPPPDQ